jgi:shikimate kinase
MAGQEAAIVGCEPTVVEDLRLVAGPAFKLTLMAPAGRWQDLGSMARALPASVRGSISRPDYLEIVDGETSKASALASALRFLGLTARQLAAVGDGVNDVEMLEFAALGIAMGHAPDVLKDVATWIAPSNASDGLAAAIDRLMADGRLGPSTSTERRVSGQGSVHQGIVARHVVVAGLMGSGKSTVGAMLARRLRWPMSDSDASIEAAEGATVGELRDSIGVEAMHALEARHLLDALAGPGPSVVCPAGSVVESDACRAALAASDVAVVLLVTSPDVAGQRFLTGEHRPWYGSEPREFIARQAATRYPHYRAVADLELNTDRSTPDELAAKALEELGALGRLPGVGRR